MAGLQSEQRMDQAISGWLATCFQGMKLAVTPPAPVEQPQKHPIGSFMPLRSSPYPSSALDSSTRPGYEQWGNPNNFGMVLTCQHLSTLACDAYPHHQQRPQQGVQTAAALQ